MLKIDYRKRRVAVAQWLHFPKHRVIRFFIQPLGELVLIHWFREKCK